MQPWPATLKPPPVSEPVSALVVITQYLVEPLVVRYRNNVGTLPVGISAFVSSAREGSHPPTKRTSSLRLDEGKCSTAQ
jgi:hypothetical protein